MVFPLTRETQERCVAIKRLKLCRHSKLPSRSKIPQDYKNVNKSDPHASNARSPTTLVWIESNSIYFSITRV